MTQMHENQQWVDGYRAGRGLPPYAYGKTQAERDYSYGYDAGHRQGTSDRESHGTAEAMF